MSTIWKISNNEKINWVEKFKDIFINQKKEFVSEIFNENNFGIHNSLSMSEYCSVEFDEFNLKCEKFGLTMSASIECFDLKDDFFYFSLGKKDDKVVFEAIFKWDLKSNKAIGNGYNFKIEPKTQFIYNIVKKEKTIIRRVNIKPKKEVTIKFVIQKNPVFATNLNKSELEDHLGGTFYDFSYEIENDNQLTYWDDLKIFTNQGIFKESVLLRGIDHPLFIDNLYPDLHQDKKSFSLKDKVFPVIIYVKTINSKEYYYKYPTQKIWNFEEEIDTICLTDNLSFDWIIKT